MSVTTKTGDDGFTDIIGGKRLLKNHPIVECLGTIDELNAFLGDAKAALGDKYAVDIIERIQKDLFTLMGVLAGMPVPAGGIAFQGRRGEERLMNLIKELEAELPPFASFAIPGANPASAKLHIARTVCRRTERRMIGLGFDRETEAAIVREGSIPGGMDPETNSLPKQLKLIVPYINRLSDLLFLLAQREAGK